MAKAKKYGVCCLCGRGGELSFEHVPPKAAYNKATVTEYKWADLIEKRKIKDKPRQGGVGAHTLCEKCNNDTGAWYGGEYVKWARTCHDLMSEWERRKITFGTVVLLNVHPLRFLKQVVTCFFSNVSVPNTPTFADNPALAQFVLDKDSTILPSDFRFFMSLYASSAVGKTNLRRWPITGRIPVTGNDEGITDIGRPNIFSEITHPPFQLIMTQDRDDFDGATEITHFSTCAYDELATLEMMLRVLGSSSPFPGAG